MQGLHWIPVPAPPSATRGWILAEEQFTGAILVGDNWVKTRIYT
jgi:hypothetical protein